MIERPHPLARQRVPDEDDPALVPSHTVPAVRHGSDLERDLPPNEPALTVDRRRARGPPRRRARSAQAAWPDDSSC